VPKTEPWEVHLRPVPGSRLAFFCVPALILALLAAACGSLGAPREGLVSVVSYNVLSLFDAKDSGIEYPEFSVARGLWDEARYKLRLENLAKAVRDSLPEEAGERGPDVLCLVEVENEAVLEDLRQGPLQSAGYRWTAMVPAPGSPINNGLLSRLPLVSLKAHATAGTDARPGRYILEAELDAGRARLFLLLCHWKSKTEGAAKTEDARREAAALVRSRALRLLAADPAAAIVVCGDFNENPDEYLRVGRRYPTAFMPEGEPREGGASRILLAPTPERASFEGGEPLLWSPWAESSGFSYAYKGAKERIDGFLLSPGLLAGAAEGALRYRGFDALDAPFLLDEAGLPLPWSSGRGRGFSDHLPLLLLLESGG
jgi:endonuclease/exonuclease/phosphatase family metal-dependent hydrolase